MSAVVTSKARRVAIIQARMSSSRFPGKVLMPILGLPMIVFMVERVRQAQLVDQVLVATSRDPSDDMLAARLSECGVECHRGSLEDVLERYYSAACSVNADHVIRLTGDCPLMDADLVDRALVELASGSLDYVTNTAPPAFPDGLDVEGFTMSALEAAWKNASKGSDREHVTPYMRAPTSGLRVGSWAGFADASRLRWTVDHEDDYKHVVALVSAVGATSPVDFDRFDLYRAIERAGLAITTGHERNEGYRVSLMADDAMARPI